MKVLILSILLLSPLVLSSQESHREEYQRSLVKPFVPSNRYPVAGWGSPTFLEILKEFGEGLSMGFITGIQEGRNWTACTTGFKTLYEDFSSTFDLFYHFTFLNMLKGLGGLYIDIENSVILIKTCANGILGYIDFVDVFRKATWKEFLIHTGENILRNALLIFSEITTLIQAAEWKDYYSLSLNIGEIIYQIFFSDAYKNGGTFF